MLCFSVHFEKKGDAFFSEVFKDLKFSGGMDPAVLKELPPELLAEIESTMPLCERVKMNKRKRSTVNEKPKYAEVSSDDDFDPNGECKLNYFIHVNFQCSLQIFIHYSVWSEKYIFKM